MLKKIIVVIPNWNGADLIEECLDSLQSQTQEHSVVVVDNGSVDDSVSIVSAKYPDIHVIALPKNTGFAGGVNVGINYAIKQNAEAVALFNNDAKADKNWLKHLVDTMGDNPEAGIVACKLMLSDKKHFDSTGDFYSIFCMPLPRGRNHVDKGQYDKPETIFGGSGGASLYRIEMFKKIGLFDEAFFAYFEDVDISFRAQLAGWKVLYEPKSIVYHRLSATSSKLGSFSRYHSTKNFYMLYLKNMPGWLFWKYSPLFVYRAVRLAATSILKGAAVPYFKGIGKFISLLPHTLIERRRIQKNRTVSTKYIDSILYKHRPPKIPKIS